ncbi:MAG TPA: ferredoxin [Desulfobulbaceae bacterium]|nr:ferredoxin [Desulfobulbaceae bacterium]
MKGFRYIDGVAILQLDTEACIGCGMCVTVCPHRIFALEEKKAQIVDYNACMECKACARNCPAAAILVNPDERCGCAGLIIKGWLAKFTGKLVGNCC